MACSIRIDDESDIHLLLQHHWFRDIFSFPQSREVLPHELKHILHVRFSTLHPVPFYIGIFLRIQVNIWQGDVG